MIEHRSVPQHRYLCPRCSFRSPWHRDAGVVHERALEHGWWAHDAPAEAPILSPIPDDYRLDDASTKPNQEDS